jgi:hypothetical protein
VLVDVTAAAVEHFEVDDEPPGPDIEARVPR